MKAAIFDLDGTLIDSSSGILRSFAVAFSTCGLNPVLPLGPEVIGPPLRETLFRLSGSSDPVVLDRLSSAFKFDYDDTGCLAALPFQDVDSMLRALHSANVPLHIATNKRAVPTERILTYIGWRPLFELVYSLDTFAPPLPDKSRLLGRLLKDAGLDATQGIYIGDRREDGIAAQQNGLTFFWAIWGYGEEIDDPLPNRWFRLSNPLELNRFSQPF